ncbi:hypothetical protein BH10PSE13_BH10PSE13_01920 [soil metagenome]
MSEETHATDDTVPEDTSVRIGSFVSQHPFASAGAAIAVGAAIGLLLPRWRVTATAGSAIGRTAARAAKAIATAETARTLLAGISSATDSVKAGASRLADHVPDAETMKSGAKRVLERAGETAQKAGEQVVQAARRIKPGED